MYTEDAGMERLTILAQAPRAVERRLDRARCDPDGTVRQAMAPSGMSVSLRSARR